MILSASLVDVSSLSNKKIVKKTHWRPFRWTTSVAIQVGNLIMKILHEHVYLGLYSFEVPTQDWTNCGPSFSTSYNHLQLYTPKPYLEIYRNKIVFSGSSIWNSLPSYIQNSNSVQHFKSQYLRWINPKQSHTVI